MESIGGVVYRSTWYHVFWLARFVAVSNGDKWSIVPRSESMLSAKIFMSSSIRSVVISFGYNMLICLLGGTRDFNPRAYCHATGKLQGMIRWQVNIAGGAVKSMALPCFPVTSYGVMGCIIYVVGRSPPAVYRYLR